MKHIHSTTKFDILRLFLISRGEGCYCGDSDLLLWISASSVV